MLENDYRERLGVLWLRGGGSASCERFRHSGGGGKKKKNIVAGGQAVIKGCLSHAGEKQGKMQLLGTAWSCPEQLWCRSVVLKPVFLLILVKVK